MESDAMNQDKRALSPLNSQNDASGSVPAGPSLTKEDGSPEISLPTDKGKESLEGASLENEYSAADSTSSDSNGGSEDYDRLILEQRAQRINRLEAEREAIKRELRELAYAEAGELPYLPRQITRVRPAKKLLPRLLAVFILLFAILFFITARGVFGKGWIKNLISGDTGRMSFTIPTATHPELSEEYYTEDGRYTVEGIYGACSESVVTIEIYSNSGAYFPYGQGSGIIMTEDGYIITNAHVIDGASLAVIVRLKDGSDYNAKVIGQDIKSDLAVLKINATGLSAAQFGDSDQLRMGEQVTVIGSPAGFEASVTTGIVSGLNRMIRVNENNVSMECVQIDAAINPGNSGGALFNMWGQVVGITSSKMDSIEYDNIGFAISINAARPILEELIENGSVLGRPRIGISFYEVSDSAAMLYGVPAGLHIAGILEDCDVYNTELQIDDVITGFNGIPVRTSDDVYKILEDMKAGDTITAQVTRITQDGFLEFEITFKLEEDDSSLIMEEAVG